MVQCQNIFNVLNEYEMLQPNLGSLEMLTNYHDKGQLQSDISKNLIQVETEEIVLNGSISQANRCTNRR